MDYSIKIDYESELITEGEYEVVINNAEMKKSKKTGADYISLQFMVRDDIEQDCKGLIVYENVLKVNVYTRDGKRIKKSVYEGLSDAEKSRVAITQEYQDFKIRPLLYAQDADEDNRKLNFDSIEEVVMFLNGMNLRAKITRNDADDYHDNEYNSIDFRKLSRTQHAPKKIGQTVTANTTANEISEDDLPF